MTKAMTKDYITIKEAGTMAGKHPDTIRALLKKNKDQTKRGKGNKILIKTSFIQQVYGLPTNGQQADQEQKKKADKSQEQMLQALINELAEKNKIISQQQQTITDLTKQQQTLISQQQQISGLLISKQKPKRRLLFGRNKD